MRSFLLKVYCEMRLRRDELKEDHQEEKKYTETFTYRQREMLKSNEVYD